MKNGPYISASQAVIDGEVVDRKDTGPTQTQYQHVQARVLPRVAPPAQPRSPSPVPQQRINVRLGDSVALALPAGLQGVAIAAGAVLAWKFVLPKVAEYLGGRPAQKKRRRIKTGGV